MSSPSKTAKGAPLPSIQPLHDSTPASRERKKQKQKKVTEYPKPSQTSEDPSEDEGGFQNSENGTTSGHHDEDVKTVRRRHRTSNTGTLNRAAGRDDQWSSNDKTPRPAQEGSLTPAIAEDSWKLAKFLFRLPKILYPIWKWILLAYLLWLGATYLFVFLYRFATDALAPICATPIIGASIPFCAPSSESKDRDLNISKVATSQDELIVVMDRVGQNFDLARDMTGHEFAVRDLRIRVAASNLSRKKELTRELESLIRYTKQTAKGLSRFTAKVGKSIDTVRVFDDYAVKALEGMAERQKTPPTLPGQIISAISPFAAFSLATAADTEKQVKDLFLFNAIKIRDKVKLLLDDSFDLGHNLDIIQETLDRIKELAIDEVGDLPPMDVLKALWTRLARADDYEDYKLHTLLLTDMTQFYESASNVMKETTSALNRVEAELEELRDDFATPGLTLKDHPLEVIIALLRNSGQRLEAGKKKLEHIEEGDQPQRNKVQKEGTRTVTATLS